MAIKTSKTTPAPTARKMTKPKVEAPMIVKPQPKPAPAPVAARPQPRPQPTHDQIAHRAYEIFADRGYTHGNHEQDWLQAERELNGQK